MMMMMISLLNRYGIYHVEFKQELPSNFHSLFDDDDDIITKPLRYCITSSSTKNYRATFTPYLMMMMILLLNRYGIVSRRVRARTDGSNSIVFFRLRLAGLDVARRHSKKR